MISIKKFAWLLLLGSCFVSCRKDTYNAQPSYGYQNEFNDDFNADTHNWSFSDPADSAFVSINNGYLDYYYNPPLKGSNTVAIDIGLNINYNFTLATSIQSNNVMGLAFGVSNAVYGYAFMVDNNGNFALYNEGSASVQPQAILDWQSNPAVKINTWNTLEIDQVGSAWQGYINGTKVFDMQSQPLSGTKIGFIVLNGTEGYADYLTAQW
ncbi:MAG TPA: family 16 glycoside hydrolase [Flavipsychrobacter sp.]|nr:family 16 glycoside hydrolase [Flavipsychrobacter sp.]